MTDSIVWGPEILVNGKRPEWLQSGCQPVEVKNQHGWHGADDANPDNFAWVFSTGATNITHIRLPADHPHYRQPTTPERDPALWDRMVHVIDRHVAGKTALYDTDEGPNCSVEAEFRAIVAALNPVDPDLIEAREVCFRESLSESREDSTYLKGGLDNSLSMRCALAAIKRGRELSRQGDAA